MIRSCWSLVVEHPFQMDILDWTPLRSWRLQMVPGGLSPPPGFLLQDVHCELRLPTTLSSYLVRTVSIFHNIQNVILSFLSGGTTGSESELRLNTIHFFNTTEQSWQPAGQMTVPREYHAVELIEDVSQNCP